MIEERYVNINIDGITISMEKLFEPVFMAYNPFADYFKPELISNYRSLLIVFGALMRPTPSI